MTRLLGKNVSSRRVLGIGEAIAIRFGAGRPNVAINYNSGADRAEAVRAQVAQENKSGKSLTVKANVADEQEVKTMFATVLKELGSLDILINNSGIQKPAASDELDMADFDRVGSA